MSGICPVLNRNIDRETWTALDTDVKGDAYEGLLQKNAEDTKKRGYEWNARRHARLSHLT